MQSGLGTIVCKFGSVPAICLREEAICAKVCRWTPHDCISSWNELIITTSVQNTVFAEGDSDGRRVEIRAWLHQCDIC